MKMEKRRQDKTFTRMYHRLYKHEYDKMQQQDFYNTITKNLQIMYNGLNAKTKV